MGPKIPLERLENAELWHERLEAGKRNRKPLTPEEQKRQDAFEDGIEDDLRSVGLKVGSASRIFTSEHLIAQAALQEKIDEWTDPDK